MSKKNSEIQGFDYPDLDLSDQEPPQRPDNDDEHLGDPTKKTKIDESIQKTNQVQIKNNQSGKQASHSNPTFRPQAPFFPPPPPGSQSKAQSAWVPPPPMMQKPPQNQQNYHRQQQYQKNQYVQNRDNRQKKNTVYVKNIPKSFNTQEKLMTFFKNEGPIKQIKVNQVEQSAVIKFVKEQNAAKFLKSNKIIFNRSYIVYGENEYLTVTQQQVNDRINDELGNVKKAEKTNLKVLKEKVSNQLAQNIRALYFIQNHLVEEDAQLTNKLRKEIEKQIQSKAESKRVLQTQNLEEFKPQDHNTSDYNWSAVFVRKSNSGMDRKHLFTQFLKYGPLIAIDSECISQKPADNQNQNENQQVEDAPKPYLDYRIKVLFLGIKHAWALYKAKNEDMGLTMQGRQIQKFFESGKLKTVQLKKIRQTEPGLHALSHEDKHQTQNVQKVENSHLVEPGHIEQVQGQQPINF